MRNFQQMNRFYQPRKDLIRGMQQQGMSTAPVQHWTQGLGRIAQALVARHLDKKLQGEMDSEMETRKGKMAEMIKSMMTEKIGEEDIGIEEQFQEQGGLNKFTPPTPESLGILPPIDEVTGEPQKSYANDMDKFKIITDSQTIADGGIPGNVLSPGSNEMFMGKFTQPQRYQGTGEGYTRATNDIMGLGKMGKMAMAMNEMSPGGMDMSPLMQYQMLQEGRKYSADLLDKQYKRDRSDKATDSNIAFGRAKELKGIFPPQKNPEAYREWVLAKKVDNYKGSLEDWKKMSRTQTEKIPLGYATTKDGGLRVLPGGPADVKAQPLPPTISKTIADNINLMGTSKGISKDMAALEKQLNSKSLDLGFWANMGNWVKNQDFVPFYKTDKESANFASFKSTLEKLRNDSLRLNNGVQTDGDAQRAWSELFQNITSPVAVKQRLKEIKAINQRAMQLRKMEVDFYNKEYKRDPFDLDSLPSQQTIGLDSANDDPAGIR